MTGPDDELMRRFRHGDDAAFEALYERYRVRLWRYLARLCGGRDRAADLFQDTWGRVIAAGNHYHGSGRFPAWLFRIARNLWADDCRRRGRTPAPAPVQPDNLAGHDHDPVAATQVEESSRRLADSFDRLPDEQKETFLLRREAGLDLASIAALTGVGTETAKSRLRYATNTLRKSLAERTES